MTSRVAIIAVGVVVLATGGCGEREESKPAGVGSTGPVLTPATTVADAFVELAVSGRDRVSWADRVTFSIDGVAVGSVAPGDGVSRELRSCPAGTSQVDGHDCPVSPLDAVEAASQEVSVEPTAPDHVGCNRFVAPDVPPGLTSVSIRPEAGRRDCFTDFAVTLYVDDVGEVRWLDYTLSGP